MLTQISHCPVCLGIIKINENRIAPVRGVSIQISVAEGAWSEGNKTEKISICQEICDSCFKVVEFSIDDLVNEIEKRRKLNEKEARKTILNFYEKENK